MKNQLLRCYDSQACHAVLTSFVKENDKEGKSRCVYISRTASAGFERSREEGHAQQQHALSISWQPPPNAVGPMVMVLKKNLGPLSDLIPISRQVQLLSIAMKDREERDVDDADDSTSTAPASKDHTSIGSVLLSLRSLLSGAFMPTLGSYKAGSARAPEEEDGTAPSSVEKTAANGSQQQSSVQAKDLKNVWDKMKELDSLLEKYQQGVSIPEVVLRVDPKILEAKASWEEHGTPGSEISTAGLQTCIENDSWLNKLQTGVGVWTKDIRLLMKVGEANPDQEQLHSSVQDEMRFWSDLRTALENTKDRLDSPEVLLTFSCLRKGKRLIPVETFEKDVQANLGI